MRGHEFDTGCPRCGKADVTLRIDTANAPRPATRWSPAEGPEVEWTVVAACEECGYGEAESRLDPEALLETVLDELDSHRPDPAWDER